MNISILGIGKLGLCLALCFEKAGYNVLGIDLFESYVRSINEKKFNSYEPKLVEYLKKSKNLRASTSLKEGLEFSDIIFILVDTPNGGGENFYDHSKLSNLLTKINDQKVKNKHIIICCTVMPTYVDRVGKYLLDDCENTTLNYNPEFIAQGNIIEGLENPDIVLIGEETAEAGQIIENIYLKVCNNQPHICRMPPLEAEITKIAINGYITMKISYANMIGDVANALNVNAERILNAIGKDSRIGNKYFRAGYSFGGPCFPRDTHAISQFIRNIGLKPVMTEASREYNILHTQLEVEALLKKNQEIYIIEDVCYKEDSHIPIIEESDKLRIAQELVKRGKNVVICDLPHMIRIVKMNYGSMFSYKVKNN